MLFFLIAILQGILEIRTKQPNVKQLRLLQLIVLYSKEWREGVFTLKVKFTIRGNLVLSTALRSGSVLLHSQHYPWLQQFTSILCLSEEETKCRIFSNPSNIAVIMNDTAFISLGVKNTTLFLYLLVFSHISSFE